MPNNIIVGIWYSIRNVRTYQKNQQESYVGFRHYLILFMAMVCKILQNMIQILTEAEFKIVYQWEYYEYGKRHSYYQRISWAMQLIPDPWLSDDLLWCLILHICTQAIQIEQLLSVKGVKNLHFPILFSKYLSIYSSDYKNSCIYPIYN